jgi:hypothetical protein
MMISARFLGLMDALHALARDQTLTAEDRTLAAETAIKGSLAGDAATRNEMLDALKKELIPERGEFWDTVREIIEHLRPAD